MRFAPDSESLREYNACHAPDSGRFCANDVTVGSRGHLRIVNKSLDTVASLTLNPPTRDGYANVAVVQVHSAWRNRGAGKALYLKAAEVARAQGLKGIMSGVNSRTPDASRVWDSLRKTGRVRREVRRGTGLPPEGYPVDILEYNKCHDPKSGQFASATDAHCGDPGELASHMPRELTKLGPNAPYGTEGIYPHTETVINDKGERSERLKWYDVKMPGGKFVQLKGEILDDAALHGKLLFHVTGALDKVLASGKLIAFAGGGGLGGGNHPAVSFTASRKDALNILDVMNEFKTAVDLVDGASSNDDAVVKFEAHLKRWADRELRALAARQYPPQPGDSPLDRVPMTVLNGVWDGQSAAVKEFKFHLDSGQGNGDRGEAVVDTLRTWLWSRDTAGLGQNPVLFTRAKNLRGKQFGLLAVPTRNLPKRTMVNYGADKFQSEVEVHGDVPITGAYFLTRKPRKGAK